MISIQLRKSLLECIETIDADRFKELFGRLRFLLMENQNELTNEEINAVLDLFVFGLENSSLKHKENWSKENGNYFSGNAFLSTAWKDRFQKCDFTLSSLVDYVEEIKKNPVNSNLDFSLRNAEVTLRDDVIFDNLPIYKGICKSVLNDILNGKAR